jgi:TonB family protein
MFKHLLESKPVRTRSRSAAIISLVVHVALAGSAVAATKVIVDPIEPVDVPPPMVLIPVAEPAPAEPRPHPVEPEPTTPTPTTPTAPTPPQPTVDVPTDVPDGIPAVEPSTAPSVEPVIGGTPSTGTPGTGEGTPASSGSGEPLWADEVEKPASPIGRQREPRYPDILRAQRIEGRVVVSFVVDERGRVEPNSVRVIESAHALFEPAVKAAVLGSRFKPAEWRGRAVRQLVQQAFVFTLTR